MSLSHFQRPARLLSDTTFPPTRNYFSCTGPLPKEIVNDSWERRTASAGAERSRSYFVENAWNPTAHCASLCLDGRQVFAVGQGPKRLLYPSESIYFSHTTQVIRFSALAVFDNISSRSKRPTFGTTVIQEAGCFLLLFLGLTVISL